MRLSRMPSSSLLSHIRTAPPPTCTHPSCNGQTFSSQKGLRAHEKIHEHAHVIATDSDVNQARPLKRRRCSDSGWDWMCEVVDCDKDFKSVCRWSRIHFLVLIRLVIQKKAYKCLSPRTPRLFLSSR